jgi:glycosyltransferase involved in cell wall biosynthesis
VDSEIFHSRGRIPFDPNRKIRLIASSWSNNPRKGGPTYKWIEKNLDWNRFEFTFVGNVSEKFERARHIPPVSSEELSDLLREHDIYITASRNDPCSNALIEAMACGLPALYINDGGHPELVGFGGLPFENEEEIFPQLEKLVDDYESFQRMIVVSAMEDVAGKYLALIREAVQ